MNKLTDKQKILLQAYINDSVLEEQVNGKWADLRLDGRKALLYITSNSDFLRVKPTDDWHNPMNIPSSLLSKGKRFLLKSEQLAIARNAASIGGNISCWSNEIVGGWSENFAGNSRLETYQTDAPLPGAKVKVQLESIDIKRSYLFKQTYWSEGSWAIATVVSSQKLKLNNTYYSYADLLANWQYSDDDGVTWKECSKYV